MNPVTNGRVMSHNITYPQLYNTRMSQVTQRMSHVTHMNESCHTYARVISRIDMRHVTNGRVMSRKLTYP